MSSERIFREAAEIIRESRSLIITAGAGMGVDSGLPDFRGDRGFWKAYPAYEKLGINFMAAATPKHFSEDPEFAWGFYGHRVNLYRSAVPHEGFSLLQQWIERFDLDPFVVTSNVDGQFQSAGFPEDKIVEVHGSIHHLQCQTPCKPKIWEHWEKFAIDMETMRTKHLPKCMGCGCVARPNILMFNDWSWVPVRTNAQHRLFDQFIASCAKPVTIIELGAGTAIATIRWIGEKLAREEGASMIRINPTDHQIEAPHMSIAMGALPGLLSINAMLH
jgi:NAD-dependent SIR2 family protein deacetylase